MTYRPSYRMRRYLADMEAKIPPRKAELPIVANLLEYAFVDLTTHAPAWEISFTIRLRETKIEQKVYTLDELRPLKAKLLTGGDDIPLEIKGAQIALGAFVLLTNYTRAARQALYGRPQLLLTFTFEGAEPIEHRSSRYKRRAPR